MEAATPEAVRLLLEGSLTFARIERNGIRIDTDYLDRSGRETVERIREAEANIRKDPVYRLWKRRFGDKANVGSKPQLARILYGDLGLTPPSYTEKGQPSTDKEALAKLKLPFADEFSKIEVLRTTEKFLKGIRKEVVDGVLHPHLNLHTAVSFRSSASDPNSQNWPSRNPGMMRAIRRCFIPRAGNYFCEIDFKGAEVRVSCCYTHDPQMIKEFTGKDGDPHGDTARELFGLEKHQVDKKSTRDWSKNRWVFPQFYGSVYFQCAPHLWEVASDDKYKLPGTDVSVRQHLESQGITRLGDCDPKRNPQPGTFEYRCQQVERSFWEDRFKVYHSWKRKTWAQYQRDGFIRTLTGFVCRWGKGGPLARNDALNYGIQSASFHCLLKTLILLQNWLLEHKMKSRIVNQVHDSVAIDLVPSEKDDVFAYVKWVVTRGLPKEWGWITVPLDVEAEMPPEPDMSWAEKSAVPM